MTAFCPNCGLDLTADIPIERDGLSMFPYGKCRYEGHEIHLRPSEAGVLYTLLKADGQPVKRTVIAERIGYDGERPGNLVDVHLARLRKKLEPHGFSIVNYRGAGVALET